MEELTDAGGSAVETNQVLYNLASRGIDFDLIPQCTARGLPVMAYSPLGQGGLATDARIAAMAKRHDATPAQVALAWVLRRPGVIAIPKAVRPDHVRDNRAALEIALTEADLKELDAAFPPPRRKQRLDMI